MTWTYAASAASSSTVQISKNRTIQKWHFGFPALRLCMPVLTHTGEVYEPLVHMIYILHLYNIKSWYRCHHLRCYKNVAYNPKTYERENWRARNTLVLFFYYLKLFSGTFSTVAICDQIYIYHTTPDFINRMIVDASCSTPYGILCQIRGDSSEFKFFAYAFAARGVSMSHKSFSQDIEFPKIDFEHGFAIFYAIFSCHGTQTTIINIS